MRAALSTVGADGGEFDYHLVTDASQLHDVAFAGSPTILVDGVDLFPSKGATRDLASRVHVSEGRMAGLPSVDDIAAALGAREGEHAEG